MFALGFLCLIPFQIKSPFRDIRWQASTFPQVWIQSEIRQVLSTLYQNKQPGHGPTRSSDFTKTIFLRVLREDGINPIPAVHEMDLEIYLLVCGGPGGLSGFQCVYVPNPWHP